MPYVPLDLQTPEETFVEVNIAPAPTLSFETQSEAVSPAVRDHVEAARTAGLKQFDAAPGAVGLVRQSAVEALLAAVPKELADAQVIPDSTLRDAFVQFHRATLRR